MKHRYKSRGRIVVNNFQMNCLRCETYEQGDECLMRFVPATGSCSHRDGPRVIDSRKNKGARSALDSNLRKIPHEFGSDLGRFASTVDTFVDKCADCRAGT